MMSRIIMILLLVLASFGAYAEVDMNAFDKLNAKMDCIIAHGGMRSKKSSICFQTDARIHETIQTSAAAQVVSTSKEWPYRNVGGDSFKKALLNAVRKAPTKAEKEVIVGMMTHTAVYSLPNMTVENKRLLFPVMHSHYRVLTKLSTDDSVWEKWPKKFNTYSKGDKFEGMVFGNGTKTKSNVKVAIRPYRSQFTGEMTEFLPAFDIIMPDGTKVPFLLECWNLTSSREIIQPVVPGKPVVTVEHKMPPSISIYKKENQKRAIAIAELNVGVWAGKYWGPHYGGVFSGTKDLIYFPISGLANWEEQVSVGAGIYGAQERGNSHDSVYRGKSSRLLPIVSVKGNGFGGVGGPDVVHQWEVSFGYGSDSMSGHNSDSGWRFSQQTKLAMMYAGWVEQNGKWVYGLTAEGFLGVSEKHNSSFSGASAEKRSTARIGGLVEYRFHKHISAKLVAQATFMDAVTPRFGGEFGAYLCGRGGWNRGQDFAIACGGGGIAIGQGVIPFVGVNAFAGHVFTMYVESEKAKKIFYAPADYPVNEERRISPIPGAFIPMTNQIEDNGGKQEKR